MQNASITLVKKQTRALLIKESKIVEATFKVTERLKLVRRMISQPLFNRSKFLRQEEKKSLLATLN